MTLCPVGRGGRRQFSIAPDSALICISSLAGLYQTGAFSVALAATYLAHVLYFSRDVLHLPTIQRHRYFRIKQQLPAVVAHAAAVAAVGCFLGLITSLLSGGGVPTPIALVSLFEGCLLCVLCWMMGTVAIEVVFTERLRPHDYGSRDPAAALEQCLEGKRGAIMRLLALHDLSLLAIDAGKESWRRTDVFADETGARWVPLAQHCVAAIQDLTASMAPAKSGPAPKGGKETAGRQGSKWNAIPAAVIKVAPTSSLAFLPAWLMHSCVHATLCSLLFFNEHIELSILNKLPIVCRVLPLPSGRIWMP